MRTDTNEPVIVDFGLAIYSDSKDYIYKHCGTPGYVAPEILSAKNDGKVCPKADIFSLGIVFHNLLFRKFPYIGKDYSAILEQNRKANFNFDSIQYFHLPELSKQMMAKMLEKNPKNRIFA